MNTSEIGVKQLRELAKSHHTRTMYSEIKASALAGKTMVLFSSIHMSETVASNYERLEELGYKVDFLITGTAVVEW